ncbi:putative longevity-assurance protein [Microthyrium microscopicum]|uniref:Putative longevity-assurance protein n=1 Tax=Microthyrium microscopicum TaxID=703497 RepID=A0A6A6UNL1_9PEZI|nr:putative longevity-assurance protein [Microthyrium microscopicum]
MTAEKDTLLIREQFVPPRSKVTTRRRFVARKAKRKEESLFAVLCAWIVDQQIGICVNLLILLGLVHFAFPRARQYTRKFYELSYFDSESGNYGRGWDDVYFITLWAVIFTGLRAMVIDYILKPFARWGGIESKKLRTRFAEQAWAVIYYTASWSLGMYIMYNSSYWLNTWEMWTHWPTWQIAPLFKLYYLAQIGYWIHMLAVIFIEERRKDHWQMFTHHVFTSLLLITSYGHYMNKVGNVILCIMDFVDIVLATAKVLNYFRFRLACDIAFGVFLVSWFVTRHVLYNRVFWSVAVDLHAATPYGCYETTTGRQVTTDGGSAIWANVLQPFNDQDGLVCFNKQIEYGFLGLLAGLQVLTIIWFGMIIRVAYGVLSGKKAEDTRSDDEDDCDSEEEEEIEVDDLEKPEDAPIEFEVDASEVTGAFKTERAGSPATRSKTRKSAAARASAISIPGHGDHKELLGRIGCDKPT